MKEEYDKAGLWAEIMQKKAMQPKECETLKEALEESQAFTEDKISIIILSTAEEKHKEEQIESIKVQAFGNFEVFYKDNPVTFFRAKSKELLAYLIDRRGASVTTAEACGVLWENKEYNFSLQRQFQTVVSDLMKSLKRCKADHVIRRKRNCLSIDVEKIDCDFYKFLEGDKAAKAHYNGEYMSNYSWAELTAGYLLQKCNDEK